MLDNWDIKPLMTDVKIGSEVCRENGSAIFQVRSQYQERSHDQYLSAPGGGGGLNKCKIKNEVDRMVHCQTRTEQVEEIVNAQE